MYNRIMVPVDLGHVESLDKALSTARDLAGHYKSEIVYVGVSAATPSSMAHTPAEFAEKLSALASAEAEKGGVKTAAHPITSHDPAVDLDPMLLKAVDETGADLVVMASHIPSLTDYLWPSNGGTIASRAKVSVMVVRG